MTADEFRALALALPEAVEREHMGHPDFRVRNKIFATLSEDETSGVLKLTLDQQEELVGNGEGPFEALRGTWGMRGWTRLRLAEARKDPARRALRTAWENAAPKELRARPQRTERRRDEKTDLRSAAPRRAGSETKRRTAGGLSIGIALIRGINVTGRNRLPMESLRAMCGKLGLCDVRTYIASGNVLFRCDAGEVALCSDRLEAAIEKRHKFRPRVIMRTLPEVRRVLASDVFPDIDSLDPSRVLVMFLGAAPGAAARKAVGALNGGSERFVVRGREAFLYYPQGAGRAETPMSAVEKALGMPGTCRNWNTVRTLVEMGEELEAAPPA